MIEVLHPGLFTTVQDLGRVGWTHVGVSPAGAADAVALRTGNWLVGNPANAPALEMTLIGARVLFHRSAIVSITGRSSSFRVDAGQEIDVGVIANGCRVYFCVSGGIAVPDVLGSASTHVRSGLGGHEGRALRRGDRLPLGDGAGKLRMLPPEFAALDSGRRSRTLTIVRGVQAEGFAPDAWQTLLSSEYEVLHDSDRMGLRLAGPTLAWNRGEMQSEGVPLGAVQVPPSGEPILLGVDAQTTGGYPVLGAVITASLSDMGQLRPRDRIRFEAVSLERAWQLARDWGALLRRLEQSE